MRGWWRCGIPAVMVAGVLGTGVPGAEAQCLDAVVYVTREGQGPVYVYGENDPCVTETPWGQTFTYHEETTQSGLPTGAPNGYWIDLRVPAP